MIEYNLKQSIDPTYKFSGIRLNHVFLFYEHFQVERLFSTAFKTLCYTRVFAISELLPVGIEAVVTVAVAVADVRSILTRGAKLPTTAPTFCPDGRPFDIMKS
ncbi:hypothetical protein GQX74_006010 [Glossina fuscipes]|nr:hypothetical protein GQX74_006010 [Glossina fuscipes]